MMQIMPSFLPNDAVSDTTAVRLCTIADLIKKTKIHFIYCFKGKMKIHNFPNG